MMINAKGMCWGQRVPAWMKVPWLEHSQATMVLEKRVKVPR